MQMVYYKTQDHFARVRKYYQQIITKKAEQRNEK